MSIWNQFQHQFLFSSSGKWLQRVFSIWFEQCSDNISDLPAGHIAWSYVSPILQVEFVQHHFLSSNVKLSCPHLHTLYIWLIDWKNMNVSLVYEVENFVRNDICNMLLNWMKEGPKQIISFSLGLGLKIEKRGNFSKIKKESKNFFWKYIGWSIFDGWV